VQGGGGDRVSQPCCTCAGVAARSSNRCPVQCHTRLFSLPKSMRRLLQEEDNVLSIQRPPVMHVGKGIM